jgi:hypothetical protein
MQNTNIKERTLLRDTRQTTTQHDNDQVIHTSSSNGNQNPTSNQQQQIININDATLNNNNATVQQENSQGDTHHRGTKYDRHNQNNQQTNDQDNHTTIQQVIPQYNTTPNRKNESWVASVNNLPPTTFRIYFQNINGLQLRTTQLKWAPHLQFMNEKGISISGFAKTNMNWHHKNIKKQLSITTQSFFQNYSLAFSENRFNPPDR